MSVNNPLSLVLKKGRKKRQLPQAPNFVYRKIFFSKLCPPKNFLITNKIIIVIIIV